MICRILKLDFKVRPKGRVPNQMLDHALNSAPPRRCNPTRPGFPLTIVVAVAIVAGLGFTARAQNGQTFHARLSPVPVTASTVSKITGSGSATAVLEGRQVTITGSFEGLASAATSAQIFRGPKGIRGTAIFELTISKAPSGTLSGSLDLTPQQADDLVKGRWYVQIQSESAPDGNLWGWLLP